MNATIPVPTWLPGDEELADWRRRLLDVAEEAGTDERDEPALEAIERELAKRRLRR